MLINKLYIIFGFLLTIICSIFVTLIEKNYSKLYSLLFCLLFSLIMIIISVIVYKNKMYPAIIPQRYKNLNTNRIYLLFFIALLYSFFVSIILDSVFHYFSSFAPCILMTIFLLTHIEYPLWIQKKK